MAVPLTTRLERARARLTDIQIEQRRQMQFVGERLGVFARLRELEREQRRVEKRVEQLEQSLEQS